MRSILACSTCLPEHNSHIWSTDNFLPQSLGESSCKIMAVSSVCEIPAFLSAAVDSKCFEPIQLAKMCLESAQLRRFILQLRYPLPFHLHHTNTFTQAWARVTEPGSVRVFGAGHLDRRGGGVHITNTHLRHWQTIGPLGPPSTDRHHVSAVKVRSPYWKIVRSDVTQT